MYIVTDSQGNPIGLYELPEDAKDALLEWAEHFLDNVKVVPSISKGTNPVVRQIYTISEEGDLWGCDDFGLEVIEVLQLNELA